MAGEDAACDYLKKNNYNIIVCKDGVVSFVEVKTWDSLDSFDLSYVINRQKGKRIVNASMVFLRDYKGEYTSIRFDVLLIKDDKTIYEYYRNVYMGSDLQ